MGPDCERSPLQQLSRVQSIRNASILQFQNAFTNIAHVFTTTKRAILAHTSNFCHLLYDIWLLHHYFSRGEKFWSHHQDITCEICYLKKKKIWVCTKYHFTKFNVISSIRIILLFPYIVAFGFIHVCTIYMMSFSVLNLILCGLKKNYVIFAFIDGL